VVAEAKVAVVVVAKAEAEAEVARAVVVVAAAAREEEAEDGRARPAIRQVVAGRTPQPEVSRLASDNVAASYEGSEGKS
jgi:hypothetical protein